MSGTSKPTKVMETLLFDLDGTLYPIENGYHTHVRRNLWRFMSEKLGIEEPEKVWKPLFQKYNQTAKGLRVGGGYEFDHDEFWAFIRAGTTELIHEAPTGVKSALENLPQDKYVFTNCNEKEAEEALSVLGIRHHFKGVFGATAMGDDKCKPDQEAFIGVLESIGADPRSTAMFEDSFKNLVAAKSLGISTVFIQSDTAREEGVKDDQLETVDAIVKDVTEDELRAQAPWLWAGR